MIRAVSSFRATHPAWLMKQRDTGREQDVKTLHGEEVTIHITLEPCLARCGVSREEPQWM